MIINPTDPKSFPTHWSEFERTVASLLSLSGYEVSGELLVGSKKVDLFATVPRFGKSRRYAVECKAYDSRLTRDHLVRIETDYATLREENLIDELLLVTLNGVAPAALARINESRFLNHQTLDELRFSIIDFRAYLNDLSTYMKRKDFIVTMCLRVAG